VLPDGYFFRWRRSAGLQVEIVANEISTDEARLFTEAIARYTTAD